MFIVYRNYLNSNWNYVLMPKNEDRMFDNFEDIKQAIKEDEKSDLYEEGDTAEYRIINIKTNETFTIRAINVVTYTLEFDIY